MTYEQLQAEQREWSLANFGEIPAELQALKVLEEIGELAGAHVVGILGKRGKTVDATAMKRDAVGDIVIALAGYCTCKGWNLAEEVRTAKDMIPVLGFAATLFPRMGARSENPRGLLNHLITYCEVHADIDFDAAVFDTWAVVKQREFKKPEQPK